MPETLPEVNLTLDAVDKFRYHQVIFSILFYLNIKARRFNDFMTLKTN